MFTEDSKTLEGDKTLEADKEEIDHVLRIQPLESDGEEFVDIQSIAPLKGDEGEVKEGKGLKILTATKVLTRLRVLLAQIKVGNNSYKLRNEIRKILIFSITDYFYQHNKITKKMYNKLIKP